MSTLSSANIIRSEPVKITSAMLSAAVITILLFAAMQQLIKSNTAARPEPVQAEPVQLYEVAKDSEIIVRQTPPPMPPAQQQPLPKPLPPVDSTPNISPGPVSIAPVQLPQHSGPDNGWTAADRGATPLVRVEPRYPTDAARDGISGWVKLAFTIAANGAVTDVSVIAAEPARVFDREAIRALRRWKYQAKIVDGVAVSQPNMQVQLDFSLQTD